MSKRTTWKVTVDKASVTHACIYHGYHCYVINWKLSKTRTVKVEKDSFVFFEQLPKKFNVAAAKQFCYHVVEGKEVTA